MTLGPTYQLATAEDDRATRFCFKCRKHRKHTWALMDDPPERQPSYYEAVPVLRCEVCDGDHTLGFGCDYDGPHYPPESVWRVLAERAAAEKKSWDWDAIWRRFRAEEPVA